MIGNPEARNISDADTWSHPCGCVCCQGDPFVCAGLRRVDQLGRNIFIAGGEPCGCGCHDEWWDEADEAAGIEPEVQHFPDHEVWHESEEMAGLEPEDLTKLLEESDRRLNQTIDSMQQVVTEVLADMRRARNVLAAIYEEWDNSYDGSEPGNGTDIVPFIDDIRAVIKALDARLKP